MKIKDLIQNQLPSYFIEEYPQFVNFIEQYYEFLESTVLVLQDNKNVSVGDILYGSISKSKAVVRNVSHERIYIEYKTKENNFFKHEALLNQKTSEHTFYAADIELISNGVNLKLPFEVRDKEKLKIELYENIDLPITVDPANYSIRKVKTKKERETVKQKIFFRHSSTFKTNEKFSPVTKIRVTYPRTELYQVKETYNNIYDYMNKIQDNTSYDAAINIYKKFFRKNVSLNSKIFRRVDPEILTKRILDYYKNKGSENSFYWFFRIFFDEDIELYYPKVDILRLSDSDYRVRQWVQIERVPEYMRIKNATITTNRNKDKKEDEEREDETTAIIRDVKTTTITGISKAFIDLVFVNGNFRVNEEIIAKDYITNEEILRTRVLPSVVGVTPTDGGIYHERGDTFKFGSLDSDGAGEVVDLEKYSITNIIPDHRGICYVAGDEILGLDDPKTGATAFAKAKVSKVNKNETLTNWINSYYNNPVKFEIQTISTTKIEDIWDRVIGDPVTQTANTTTVTLPPAWQANADKANIPIGSIAEIEFEKSGLNYDIVPEVHAQSQVDALKNFIYIELELDQEDYNYIKKDTILEMFGRRGFCVGKREYEDGVLDLPGISSEGFGVAEIILDKEIQKVVDSNGDLVPEFLATSLANTENKFTDYVANNTIFEFGELVDDNPLIKTFNLPEPTYQNTEKFVSTATQNTNFTLAATVDKKDLLVFVDGVFQHPEFIDAKTALPTSNNSYTLTGSNTTISFSEPLPNDLNVTVLYTNPSSVKIYDHYQQFTGDGVNYDFDLEYNTDEYQTKVFVDGILQIHENDNYKILPKSNAGHQYSTLQFIDTVSPPPAGSNIFVMYKDTTKSRRFSGFETFDGDGVEKEFTLEVNQEKGDFSLIFISGVFQHQSFTAPDGTSVQGNYDIKMVDGKKVLEFDEPVPNGEKLVVMYSKSIDFDIRAVNKIASLDRTAELTAVLGEGVSALKLTQLGLTGFHGNEPVFKEYVVKKTPDIRSDLQTIDEFRQEIERIYELKGKGDPTYASEKRNFGIFVGQDRVDQMIDLLTEMETETDSEKRKHNLNTIQNIILNIFNEKTQVAHNLPATLEYEMGAMYKPFGEYVDLGSQLSENKYMQDNDYYQDFSYEIRTKVQAIDIEEFLMDELHPAGFKMFVRNKFEEELKHRISTMEFPEIEIDSVGLFRDYRDGKLKDLSGFYKDYDYYANNMFNTVELELENATVPGQMIMRDFEHEDNEFMPANNYFRLANTAHTKQVVPYPEIEIYRNKHNIDLRDFKESENQRMKDVDYNGRVESEPELEMLAELYFFNKAKWNGIDYINEKEEFEKMTKEIEEIEKLISQHDYSRLNEIYELEQAIKEIKAFEYFWEDVITIPTEFKLDTFENYMRTSDRTKDLNIINSVVVYDLIPAAQSFSIIKLVEDQSNWRTDPIKYRIGPIGHFKDPITNLQVKSDMSFTMVPKYDFGGVIIVRDENYSDYPVVVGNMEKSLKDHGFLPAAEVYTKRGWVQFQHLTQSEIIAHVEESGEITWKKMKRLHRQHYSGRMNHFTNEETATQFVALDRMVLKNVNVPISHFAHEQVVQHKVGAKVENAYISVTPETDLVLFSLANRYQKVKAKEIRLTDKGNYIGTANMNLLNQPVSIVDRNEIPSFEKTSFHYEGDIYTLTLEDLQPSFPMHMHWNETDIMCFDVSTAKRQPKFGFRLLEAIQKVSNIHEIKTIDPTLSAEENKNRIEKVKIGETVMYMMNVNDEKKGTQPKILDDSRLFRFAGSELKTPITDNKIYTTLHHHKVIPDRYKCFDVNGNILPNTPISNLTNGKLWGNMEETIPTVKIDEVIGTLINITDIGEIKLEFKESYDRFESFEKFFTELNSNQVSYMFNISNTEISPPKILEYGSSLFGITENKIPKETEVSERKLDIEKFTNKNMFMKLKENPFEVEVHRHIPDRWKCVDLNSAIPYDQVIDKINAGDQKIWENYNETIPTVQITESLKTLIMNYEGDVSQTLEAKDQKTHVQIYEYHKTETSANTEWVEIDVHSHLPNRWDLIDINDTIPFKDIIAADVNEAKKIWNNIQQSIPVARIVESAKEIDEYSHYDMSYQFTEKDSKVHVVSSQMYELDFNVENVDASLDNHPIIYNRNYVFDATRPINLLGNLPIQDYYLRLRPKIRLEDTLPSGKISENAFELENQSQVYTPIDLFYHHSIEVDNFENVGKTLEQKGIEAEITMKTYLDIESSMSDEKELILEYFESSEMTTNSLFTIIDTDMKEMNELHLLNKPSVVRFENNNRIWNSNFCYEMETEIYEMYGIPVQELSKYALKETMDGISAPNGSSVIENFEIHQETMGFVGKNKIVETEYRVVPQEHVKAKIELSFMPNDLEYEKNQLVSVEFAHISEKEIRTEILIGDLITEINNVESSVHAMSEQELEIFSEVLFHKKGSVGKTSEEKRLIDESKIKLSPIYRILKERDYETPWSIKEISSDFLTSQWATPYFDQLIEDYEDKILHDRDEDTYLHHNVNIQYVYSESIIYSANGITELLNSNNYIDENGTLLTGPLSYGDIVNSSNTYIKTTSTMETFYVE